MGTIACTYAPVVVSYACHAASGCGKWEWQVGVASGSQEYLPYGNSFRQLEAISVWPARIDQNVHYARI